MKTTQSLENLIEKWNNYKYVELTILQRTVRIVGRDTKTVDYHMFFVKITGNGNNCDFLENQHKSWFSKKCK